MKKQPIPNAVLENIFNEWVKQYAEDPESYDDILDDDGNPFSDYGKRSAEVFNELYNELGENK